MPDLAGPKAPEDQFQSSQHVSVLGAEEVSPQSLERLTSTLDRATAFFKENFGPVHQGLKVDLTDDNGALRTGFNFEQNSIRFPEAPKLINRGLNSEDIIIHEAFHALVFQAYPDICTDENLRANDSVRIHEGLADYFAYQMNPDEHFGEDYSKEKPHLRSYRNKRRISLSPGTHSQGNAITSYLLKNHIEPKQIRGFLESGDFTLEGLKKLSPGMKKDLELDASLAIQAKIPNYPMSRIRRYRLVEGKPLNLNFETNEALDKAHPSLQIRWVKSSGAPSQDFEFCPTGPLDFQVSAKRAEGSEKVVAVLSENQETIGAYPFYLSQRDPSAKPPKN